MDALPSQSFLCLLTSIRWLENCGKMYLNFIKQKETILQLIFINCNLSEESSIVQEVKYNALPPEISIPKAFPPPGTMNLFFPRLYPGVIRRLLSSGHLDSALAAENKAHLSNGIEHVNSAVLC